MSGREHTREYPAHDIGKRIQCLLGDESHMAPPPAGWRRWSVPSDPLGLDLEVKTLAEKRRAPRLLPRERLTELGIACPYWHARCIAVSALLNAFEDDWTFCVGRDQRAADAKALRAMETDIAKAVALLGKIGAATASAPLHRAFSIQPQRFAELRFWNSDMPPDPLEDALAAFASAAPDAMRALADLRDATVRARSVMSENLPDIRRLAFAATVANSWPALTGARARVNSVPLLSFMTAAGDAVGVEHDWQSALRKVIALRTAGAKGARD